MTLIGLPDRGACEPIGVHLVVIGPHGAASTLGDLPARVGEAIMATPLVSRPAPAWLRELAQARATYEELLGWPVSVQVGRRDLVLVVGGEIAAVGMPARLGLRVRQELTIALLCTPIIADPGGTHWTFLTKPVGTLRPDVAHDLAAVRVHLAPRGACVEIPSSLNTSATRGWRWIEPPQPTRSLPPGSVVVASVRRVTYDDGQLAA